MSLRFDAARATRITPTPQGGVRVDAAVTRVGVFTYYDANGKPRRELRPADEVLHTDSIASLTDAPVTRGHPAMITAANWTAHARGYVRGDARADGDKIAASLAVQEAALVQDVIDRKVVEVSCGYTCKLDETPGEYNGEKYDAVQRQIRYNHVGLGPAGWGRQGAEVSLRLDYDSAILMDEAPKRAVEKRMQKIKVDGIEYEAGSQSHLDAVAKREAALTSERDAATARADKAEGERDAAKSEAADLKAKAEKFDAAIEAKVEARAKMREDARQVLGLKAELPKSERDLMVAVCKADAKDFDAEGRSDEYLRARFDATVEHTAAGKANPAAATINDFRATVDAGAKKTEREDTRDPVQRAHDNAREAWKKPLAATAGK